MKKLIAVLLCLIMVVSVLAGCGPTAPSGGNNSDTSATETQATLPEDITLTIGIPQSGKVEDYDTNAYMLWLEEQTGYDLQFQAYQGTAADMKSQLSVAMVDGDELPDILLGFELGEGVYQEYGEDGYFIDLTPYFEDKEGKSKVWWERFEQLEDQAWRDYIWSKMVSNKDGRIYAFPRLESTQVDTMRHQTFINQDWLDKLGLPMPTDVESFYNTLVAFRDKDPNGNGKKDEVPLIGHTNNYCDVVSYLINMFVYHDNSLFWNADEQGKLYHVYASDEYREALKFINKLVKEGLMPASVWTMNNKDVKGMINPAEGEVQTVGAFCGHPSVVLISGNQNALSYEAMPYWGYVALDDQTNLYNTYITEDCEYPDAAWNLLMVMSSEEGAYRQRYGEKGVDWVDADPNTTSFLGLPAVIKVLNEGAFSDIGNQCLGTITATILINAENEVSQLSDDSDEWTKHKMNMMKDCYENYYEAAKRNPTNGDIRLDYTTEEEEFITVAMTNTQAFIKQCRASFATGKGDDYTDPNDDAQWAKYVAGIEAQDIATWQKVAQQVYDLQNSGK